MDDSFELEYADELDALDEFDCDDPTPVEAPKRVLFDEAESQRIQKPSSQTSQEASVSYFQDNRLLNTPSMNNEDHCDNIKRKRMVESMNLEDEIDGDFDVLQTISSKRVRLTEEEEMEDRMLRQILQQRNLSSKHTTKAVSDNVQCRLNDDEDFERQRVFKRIPQCDFVSARSYDGRSVYMKLWDEDVLQSEYDSMADTGRQTNFLTVPVWAMREQIDQLEESEMSRQETDSSEGADVECLGKAPSTEPLQSDCTMTDTNGNSESLSDDLDKMTQNMKSLWVEKYAPKKYTELLSEEAVNRSLLHWMRLWDFVVFNKDVPKPRKKDTDNKNKFKKKIEPDILESLDKFHRPQQKVALLCGPPGLGKTTLAHIVARHAGYNVVEMNASDDRTVDTFRTKLESATQMKAVLGADHSPNCLVIDEIDGAPAPAINVLLNMIKKSDLDEASSKKKKGGILRRPIICICNDQYVPALRQLRQIALLVNFPQTEASRLASRLYEVIQVEQLKTDINTLLALCERTDNDIRACLNTLQFIRQKQKELSVQTVRTMSVGQKDSQKSLFSVWNDVFSMPREKKNRFISIHDLTEGHQKSVQGTNITPQARFQHVLQMVQSAGEYDRIMQGLFENYLAAKSKDPHLTGLTQANEWLEFADGINCYVSKTQDYSVAKYTSFLPVFFHFLYASFTPHRLLFPQSQHEANQKLAKTQNLLTAMTCDMTPTVRKFVQPDAMVMDLLSPLMDILQPTLRPVNTLLYSQREKEELASVVRIMIAYNITYRQEKSLEGQYNYVLDPNIEEIIQFPDLKQRKQLTYAAKQMIAREIDLDKMRRTEAAKEAMATYASQNNTPAATKANQPSNKSKKPSAPAVPNHLQKLEAKKIDSEKPAINFFGNFIRTKREKPIKDKDSSLKDDKAEKRKLLDTVIWFHFKEGYSNAVRRTVKVKDFL